MTVTSSTDFFKVDLKNVKKLDISLTPVKLSDEFQSRLENMYKAMYTRPVNLENHPSQKAYAEVIVNGKSVATVYNNGTMMSSNAGYSKIQNLPSVKDPQGNGPDLAQQRANDIAKALGGKVVKSSTAITASQFMNLPPIEFKTDYAALEKAMKEFMPRTVSSKTLVDAQLLTQNKSDA